MPKTRARSLHVMAEASYGVDPSTTGASYLYVPAMNVGDLQDGKALLETNYNNGENWPTAGVAGPDGWSFDFEVPLIGMATAAGNGVNASTVTADWLDALKLHVLGTLRTTPGLTLTGTTVSTLTAASSPYSAQDIAAVFLANVPTNAPRSQLALITNSASPYSIAPSMVQSPGASVAYGGKHYRASSDGGASLAFVYTEDDLMYLCLGGRITAYVESADSRGIWKAKVTVSGDSKALTSTGVKTSLPAAAAPAVTPLICTLSPVFFNGSAMETKSISIDYGVNAQPYLVTGAPNGRGDFLNIALAPKISVEPLRTDAHLLLKRNGTTGRLMIQQGAGVLSGGVLNLGAFHAESVQAMEVAFSDDSGRARQKIDFTVVNPGAFSAGVPSQKIQSVRF